MDFNDAMAALAENAGVEEGFAPDEDGVVHVGCDDLTLSFTEVPEAQALVIWSPIRTLPETGAEKLKTSLLKANFMGRAVAGGTLSLSDDGVVYLHQTMQLLPLDKSIFLRRVEDFLMILADWTSALAAYDPTAADAAPDGVRADETDLSGFIKV